MQNLEILFAGKSVPATYLDGATDMVFVRALPQFYLLTHFLIIVEQKRPVLQLCCYLPAGAGEAPAGDYPEVPPPAGKWSVPQNWADNLSDESVDQLYEAAKHLNFSRTAQTAKDAIKAKQLVAPLHEMAIETVMPLVDQILNPLRKRLETFSGSMPSVPSSSAAPAAKSS